MLEGGRVLDVGSHAELIARAGLYSRLYRAQQLASPELDEPLSLASLNRAAATGS